MTDKDRQELEKAQYMVVELVKNITDHVLPVLTEFAKWYGTLPEEMKQAIAKMQVEEQLGQSLDEPVIDKSLSVHLVEVVTRPQYNVEWLHQCDDEENCSFTKLVQDEYDKGVKRKKGRYTVTETAPGVFDWEDTTRTDGADK